MIEILFEPVEKIALLIKGKQLSPVELTKLILEHIDKVNEQVNAYITINDQEAIKAAKYAEEEIMMGNYRGMYHGVPIGIKDNIYIKDMKATIGSKIHRNFIPDYDADVICKLREAGAIFLGKLNMHEYAWGITNNNPHYGSVKNPWNLDKIAGGSSGGSGAAVAAGMAYATLGTDTGGSIRIPASACGIVGLKPTYGRVSNHGSFPLASTLDHIGPMTRTVKDAASLLDIISIDGKQGFTENLSSDLNGIVLGIHEEFFFGHIDPEIEKLVRKSIDQFVDMGAEVIQIDIPSIDSLRWAQSVILRSEFAALHRENREKRLSDYGDDIQEQFKEELPSVIDYLHALEIREKLQNECATVFNDVDALIGPTLSILPPNIGDEKTYLADQKVDVFEYILRLTGFANTTGLPAISIPCGFVNGLPVGLQIIGKAFDEQTILNIAYAFEQTHNAIVKRPRLDIRI